MQALQFFAVPRGGRKALVGPGGWLFYQPGVSCLTQRARPGDSTVQDAVTAVTALSRRSRGARHPPHRHARAEQGERVSGPAGPFSPPRPRRSSAEETRAFLARCKAAGVEVVDLFALYRDARDGRRTRRSISNRTAIGPPPAWRWRRTPWPARLFERGWLTPGTVHYDARPAPIRELGDLVRMIRSPQIEARLPPQSIATEPGRPAAIPAPFSPTTRRPKCWCSATASCASTSATRRAGPGFVAHLALALGRPVAGIINDGGASTLVRQELYRRPRLLSRAKVVVWEFAERDIRLGTEGWQTVPLPPHGGTIRTFGDDQCLGMRSRPVRSSRRPGGDR